MTVGFLLKILVSIEDYFGHMREDRKARSFFRGSVESLIEGAYNVLILRYL